MQAIQTKYHGPTDHSGSRISATCDAGRIIIGWDHALNVADNHRAAADALVVKLGWDGERSWRPLAWTSGSLKDGSYVHVCHFDTETWRPGDFASK